MQPVAARTHRGASRRPVVTERRPAAASDVSGGGFSPAEPRIVKRCAREPLSARVPDEVRTTESPPAARAPEPPPPHASSACEFAPRTLDLRLAPAVAAAEPDERRIAALARTKAIELAGLACARALHEAVARNPLFVARFVDEALAAAGAAIEKRVRLSPVDAAACEAHVAARVDADERLARGEVVVETSDGAVRATIEDRCDVFVRAAAER